MSSQHLNNKQQQQHHEQDHSNNEDDDQELNEEEIVQVIIQLGNDILKNLRVEDPIDDVAVFFGDEFYIQFFQAAFPEIDFSQLTPGEDVNEMAENIQALVDLLGEQILKYDLSHIKGEEIVSGNPEHCINLLQLVQEISVMIQGKQQPGAANANAGGSDSKVAPGGPSSSEGRQPAKVNGLMHDHEEDDEDEYGGEEEGHHEEEGEDDEAQYMPNNNRKQLPPIASDGEPSSSHQNRRGGNSDPKQQQQQFLMDGDYGNEDEEEEEDDGQNHMDFGNNQHPDNMVIDDDEEDDDDLEQQFMQQLQQQNPNLKHDDEEEDDLKMYEQFLAANKQHHHHDQGANHGGNGAPGGPIGNISNINPDEDDDDEEEMDHGLPDDMEGAHQQQMDADEEDGNEEIDLDNIDYDQLDPQILEIAEQMGVHPKEVLKQIMQMNSEGGMGDDDEDEEGEDPYGQEDMEGADDIGGHIMGSGGGVIAPADADHSREEQLRMEKELFKMQMGLAAGPPGQSADKKKQQPSAAKVAPEQKMQPPQAAKQQKPQQYGFADEYDDEDEEDAESYYSEGEIKTRIKLISQKSYSAPYIVINDCYEEPLGGHPDDDSQNSQNQMPSKAYSTTVLQNLELQEQLQQQMEQQQQQMEDEPTQQLLYDQQVKINNQKNRNQQNQQHDHDDEDEDDNHESNEEELDVDISQRLQELQHNQGSGNKNNENHDENEPEDDGDMLIDLDQLDDHNRQMLLEYLQQEYEKNPDQFPFPKELIKDYMLKQKDKIQSQEMILEDVAGDNIVIGEGNIEDDDDEIHEDDEDDAEYLDDHPNNNINNNNQEQEHQNVTNQYGDEEEPDDDENQQEEHHDPQQQLQQLHHLQQQQHQMQQMAQLQHQQMQQQQMQQPQRIGRSKKANTVGKGNKRPKSANNRNKKQNNGMYHAALPQQIQNQVIPEEAEDTQQYGQIPQDQLQQIIQLLQDRQIDLESVDPNLIQQLIMAQQQQQMPPQMLISHPQQRPSTANARKANASGSKKRATQGASKYQPYNKFHQMSVGGGVQPKVKSIAGYSDRPYMLSGKKKAPSKKSSMPPIKKRPQTAQTRQNRVPQHQMQQQQPFYPQQQIPYNLTPEQAMMLLQQQQQHNDPDVIQEEDENELLSSQMHPQLQQQPQMDSQEDHHEGEDHGEGEGEDEDEEHHPNDNHTTLQPQPQQMFEIPNFSEEYLNQLSEDQLEQLLIQQQQLMMMQQHQQQQQQQTKPRSRSAKKPNRPKSAKIGGAKPMKPITNKNPGFQVYVQKQKKLAPTTTKLNKQKKKPLVGNSKKFQQQQQLQHPLYQQGIPIANSQGVLMNNFFPALEGPGANDDYHHPNKDQRYPKFGIDNMNNPNMVVQDQIDEVPPEQEEAESQENIQNGLPNFYPNGKNSNQEEEEENEENEEQQMNTEQMQDQDQADPQQSQDYEDQDNHNQQQQQPIDLTDEQLIELIQNAHNLMPEHQQQLQAILQQRMKQELVNERAQSYDNIYSILMDNVRRAKDRLAPLGHVKAGGGGDDTEETDRRIIKQKQEFETLYRQYQNEVKAKEQKKVHEQGKVEKRMARDHKTQAIRERKFQEELLSHQKSLNFKRNAQQVKLCQKVYKLASELEKNKLLQEKREYKETQERKKQQNRIMVDTIETYYKNQIQLLKERIENERFERRVAQQAQQQALSKMKRELNDQKKLEVDRYLQLLRQEDERYEFESSNAGRIENEIINMYKKGRGNGDKQSNMPTISVK